MQFDFFIEVLAITFLRIRKVSISQLCIRVSISRVHLLNNWKLINLEAKEGGIAE